ncbi:putative single-strand DNA-binding protein [Listeria weihenstephanensis FSL R9-0317]|uniref:Single-stranded DNA-binding protein n=1 Tax=Listeria weihenstephanensis TaxID=1006155 RepID=A0A1S7FRJ5_9LIST|nr:single-stranded DNA-binding protein [Listeria weihenstephanensis]AQY50033.1 single-stranded DNA-binding protein [Listeria weihenstephanensis]EUJ40393.1 putative single-strand DNA-binding protein [Listeria weihenstephanensis FSL R9-0317]MBC1500432.1 single-stranded DNA-binding protein [Listeria weihenstephanensis]
MINQVTIVGRLTEDPEVRWTSEEKAVVNVTVALNRFGKGKSLNGDADFIPCVIWGKQAENTVEYCQKGTLVGINGELQTRNYTNREDKKVYVIEVVADKIRFLSKNKERATDDPEVFLDNE